MLIGAACGVLLLAPALARSQATTISAKDAPAWAPANLTIATGATVTFEAQGTNQPHYVEFTSGPKPDCHGVPMAHRTGEWSGTCTFPAPGDYAFRCPVHDIPPYSTMRGVIHVVTPAATPTATPSPDASATPEPGASPVPTPVETQLPARQTALRVRLASRQRGTRVRGRVGVPQAASRLEVTLRARGTRVGRRVRASTPAGTVAFSVRLDTRGRRALRHRRHLRVKVAVVLTPPDGPKLTRRRTVKLRR
jgi:plastocyanin